MQDLIVNFLFDGILLLAGAIAFFTARFILAKLGTENAKKAQAEIENIQKQIEGKQGLAWEAVKFAEQAGKDLKLKGEQKYRLAAEKFMERVEVEFGILLDEEEIEVLIKAALREIKDTFGEQWANAIEK